MSVYSLLLMSLMIFNFSSAEIDIFRAMPLFTQRCTIYRSILHIEYNQLVNTTRQPDTSTLQLYLYNGTQIMKYNIATAVSDIMASPLFDPNLPIVIYTHGFLMGMDSGSVPVMTGAFLKKGGYNVLALDTKEFIRYLYLTGSTNVRFMGEALGKTLTQFHTAGIPADKIHLIGHSLGAHVSGFAGLTFNQLTGQKIARISGLDPAGPCFFKETDDHRLSKTDATFVDVIHTDAKSLGCDDLLGHVDFFPNGGENQPNTFIVSDSHSRSWELYSSSVNNPTIFPALQCTNYKSFQAAVCANGIRNNLGFAASPNATGAFFLITSGKPPFGIGEAGVSFPANIIASIQLQWDNFIGNLFRG